MYLMMKILLVVDGSSYSDTATKTLKALNLPSQTEVTVMTVVPEHTLLGGITIDKIRSRSTASAKKKAQEEEALKLLSGPVQLLDSCGFQIESLVRWGNPAQAILRVADERDVSLILMGAKGLTGYPAFRLGSVSQTVMKHARTSVLLARKKTVKTNSNLKPEETNTSVDRVLFATDGSKYANMANQFLLDLPLPQQSQVIVVTVLQSDVDTLLRVPTLPLETDEDMPENLQAAEESAAQKIIERSIQQFDAKGYKATSITMRGGAGESILKVADEHNPDIIVLGSRGLTGIETFFLGSVSERVARHAPCSVLIVRPAKD
jgi:nucleotide-binding universal stress UspA family protein